MSDDESSYEGGASHASTPMSTAAIAGTVCGVVAFLLLVLVPAMLARRRQQQQPGGFSERQLATAARLAKSTADIPWPQSLDLAAIGDDPRFRFAPALQAVRLAHLPSDAESKSTPRHAVARVCAELASCGVDSCGASCDIKHSKYTIVRSTSGSHFDLALRTGAAGVAGPSWQLGADADLAGSASRPVTTSSTPISASMRTRSASASDREQEQHAGAAASLDSVAHLSLGAAAVRAVPYSGQRQERARSRPASPQLPYRGPDGQDSDGELEGGPDAFEARIQVGPR